MDGAISIRLLRPYFGYRVGANARRTLFVLLGVLGADLMREDFFQWQDAGIVYKWLGEILAEKGRDK